MKCVAVCVEKKAIRRIDWDLILVFFYGFLLSWLEIRAKITLETPAFSFS